MFQAEIFKKTRKSRTRESLHPSPKRHNPICTAVQLAYGIVKIFRQEKLIKMKQTACTDFATVRTNKHA